MKVSTEAVATREVLLTIEPDEQVIQRAMRRAARDISRHRPISGFRPGKAPFALVERAYGRQAILHEALNGIAPDLYRDAIREADLQPYEQTLLDIETEEPLVLKLRVPLVPQVTVGDYGALSVEPASEVVVSPEQVQAQLNSLRRTNAEARPVSRPLQMGDQITALYSRTVDGEVRERNEQVVIDMTDDVDPAGFAEALLGASTSDVREFSLSFPEDHQDEDLAGKRVDYRVAIGEIRELTLPDADDEFAKTVGDLETLAQLEESIANNLRQQREQEAQSAERRRALDALISVSTMEYPAAALEREIDRVLIQQRRWLLQRGSSLERYLAMRNQTEADLREELRPDCVRNLAQRLALTEYVKKEGLTLTAEEANEAIANYSNSMAAAYREGAAEKVREEVQNGILEIVYGDALMFKAAQHLADRLTGRLEASQATGEEASLEAPEAQAEDADAASNTSEVETGESQE